MFIFLRFGWIKNLGLWMSLDETLGCLFCHCDCCGLSLFIRRKLTLLVYIELIGWDWYHTLFLATGINFSLQTHLSIIQGCSSVTDFESTICGCQTLLNSDCFGLINDLLFKLIIACDFSHIVRFIVGVSRCSNLCHHLKWLRTR